MCFRTLIFLLFGLAIGNAVAEEEVEFQGMLITDGLPRLLLAHKPSGLRAWVVVGQIFRDHVATYQPDENAVILSKGEKKTRICMKAGYVRLASRPATEAEIRLKIGNNLRHIAAAADQFYLENGVARTTIDALVGPHRFIRQLKPVDGEDYRQLKLEQGHQLKVTTASGITVVFDP